jgi:hypothetical protein
MTRVIPAPRQAQVLVAVNEDQKLTDKQLMTLSRSGSAQIVQVICPRTCNCRALQSGLRELNGPATLVSGIGPGAYWPGAGCPSRRTTRPRPSRWTWPWKNLAAPPAAAHGHWLVAWNDNPDDTSAGFVRDQPNAETSISDYDINLPQVLNNELRKILGRRDKASAAWRFRWLKCRPAGQGHRDPVPLR